MIGTLAIIAPPDDLAEIPDGTRLDEIASRYRVTVATVRGWMTPQAAARRPRPPRPPQPQPDAATIAALYAEGRTQQQVAAAVGCSIVTVARVVREAGVARHGHPPRLDAADIGRRYQAGQSLAEIAEAVGSCKSVVSTALDRAGVKRRPWGTHVHHWRTVRTARLSTR